MIDKSNMLYTRVKNAILKEYSDIDASQTYTDAPASFPYMYFNQRDNPETASDLNGNENAVRPMVEITIYTTGQTRLTNAKKIIKLADAEMKSMGFVRLFGPQQITNVSDTSICRLIARYSRVIGANDTF